MTSVNEIFREIVGRVSERYGSHVSYLWGDWDYISNQLELWSQSKKKAPFKFPIVCLYSPFTEDRREEKSQVSLELIVMVNTLKDYTNEEREQVSFEKVLRPIYHLLMEEIAKDKRFVSNYRDIVPHRYTENYRYGRVGVAGPNGKPFRDFIDAIEIKEVDLTIKKTTCCYGKRI